jgi:hypothetical protein
MYRKTAWLVLLLAAVCSAAAQNPPTSKGSEAEEEQLKIEHAKLDRLQDKLDRKRAVDNVSAESREVIPVAFATPGAGVDKDLC